MSVQKDVKNYVKSRDKIYLEILEDIEKETYFALTSTSFVRNVFQAVSSLLLLVIPFIVWSYDKFEGEYVISERIDYIFILGFILFGFFNVLYVREFTKDEALFQQVQNRLISSEVEPKYKLIILDTLAYRVVNMMQTTYIFGTFIAASIWFLEPAGERLEPLTIIYGFGTALFGYYRIQYGGENLLDIVIAKRMPSIADRYVSRILKQLHKKD